MWSGQRRDGAVEQQAEAEPDDVDPARPAFERSDLEGRSAERGTVRGGPRSGPPVADPHRAIAQRADEAGGERIFDAAADLAGEVSRGTARQRQSEVRAVRLNPGERIDRKAD